LDLVEAVAFRTFERHRFSGVSLDAVVAGADLDGDPWVGQQILTPWGGLLRCEIADAPSDSGDR
jgi:hypothetical protein